VCLGECGDQAAINVVIELTCPDDSTVTLPTVQCNLTDEETCSYFGYNYVDGAVSACGQAVAVIQAYVTVAVTEELDGTFTFTYTVFASIFMGSSLEEYSYEVAYTEQCGTRSPITVTADMLACECDGPPALEADVSEMLITAPSTTTGEPITLDIPFWYASGNTSGYRETGVLADDGSYYYVSFYIYCQSATPERPYPRLKYYLQWFNMSTYVTKYYTAYANNVCDVADDLTITSGIGEIEFTAEDEVS
jgi:hypothetical protein